MMGCDLVVNSAKSAVLACVQARSEGMGGGFLKMEAPSNNADGRPADTDRLRRVRKSIFILSRLTLRKS